MAGGDERTVYAFGAWELDAERSELRRDGEAQALRLKPFAVLRYLVEHRERFVPKEELLDALWPGVAVSESALTTAVKAVRRALEDDGGSQTWIETRRGRGYRFVGEVAARAAAADASATPRSSDFVGRHEPLAVVAAALDQALSGAGRTLLVRGEAGIGKSRLLAECAAAARARGVPVVRAWCPEDGTSPPYWPWAQVLQRLQRDGLIEDAALARQAEVGGMLRGGVAGSTEASHAEEAGTALAGQEVAGARVRMWDGCAQLLTAAATPRGLVLHLDDTHVADDASLRLLAYLARELADSRVLVVAAMRDPSAVAAEALDPVKAEIARLPGCEQIWLEGLSEVDAGALVRGVAGDRADDEAVADALERSGGNPFFLRELARAAKDEGSVPPAVRDALGARLARLPPETNEALAVGAVVGREFPVGLVARALGREVEAVAAVLGQAEQEGLLQHSAAGLRFEHALVREAVVATLTGPRLAEVHLRVGEALEEGAEETDFERLALHYSAAANGAASRAVVCSQRAAERAMKLLAYENAVAHLERALRAHDLDEHADPALRGELLRALGMARHHAGASLPEVREAFEQALAIAHRRGDGTAIARAALGMAIIPGRIGELRSYFHEALRLRGRPADGTTAAILSNLAVAEYLELRPERSLALAKEAVALAEELDRAEVSATVYLLALIASDSHAPVAVRLERARRAIEASDRAGMPERAAVARWMLFFLRLEAGDADAAREHEAFARFIEDRRFVRARPNMLRQRAALAFIDGDLDATDSALDEAIDLARRERNPVTLGFALASRALSLRERGELAGLAQLAQLEQSDPRPLVQCAQVDLASRLGRLDEAEERLRAIDSDRLGRDSQTSPWLAACWLAEACQAVGDPDQAAEMRTWLEPLRGTQSVGLRGSICLGATVRYLGLLANVAGDRDAAVAALEDAIGENERVGATLWAAWSRCDLGRILLARGADGDRERALGLLEDAEGWAKGRPLAPLLESLRDARLRAEGVVPLRRRG